MDSAGDTLLLDTGGRETSPERMIYLCYVKHKRLLASNLPLLEQGG